MITLRNTAAGNASFHAGIGGRFQTNSVPDDSDRAPAVSSELQRPGANHTPPEVIEPDGICTQITIGDPDNPAPATIEVNDETDPKCHTPGII